MAAPAGTIRSVAMALFLDATILGSCTDASLRIQQQVRELKSKSRGNQRGVKPARKSWELPFSGFYEEGSQEVVGTIQLEVNSGTVAVPVWEVVDKLTDLELQLSLGTTDSAGADDARWRSVEPTQYTWQVAAGVRYLDPADAGNASHATLKAMIKSDEERQLRLTFGTSTLVGLAIVDTYEYGGESPEGVTPLSLTFQGHEDLDDAGLAGTVQAGLSAMVSAMISDPATTLTAKMVPVDSSLAPITGATQEEGSAYCTQLTVSGNMDEELAISGTLTGDGALNDSTAT